MTLPPDPQTAVILTRLDTLQKSITELSVKVEGHSPQR